MRPLPSLPRSVNWALIVIGLVIISGGSATAARLITGADVRDSSLTGKDVKNSSLRGRDVRNGSLKGGDMLDSSLTGGDIANRSLSARDFNGSIRGPQGAPGRNGRDGFSQLAQYMGPVKSLPPFSACTIAFNNCVILVLCPPDMFAVAGGYASAPSQGTLPPVDFTVLSSLFYFDQATKRDGWVVEAANYDQAIGTDLFATVQCTPTGLSASARKRRAIPPNGITGPLNGKVKRLPRR